MTLKKHIFLYKIYALLTICLQVGCNNNSNIGYCTDDPCHDAITIRLVATDNLLPGIYSVELLFSDNESINAEFELKFVDENDDKSNIMLQIIENASYSTSWFIFNKFDDPFEIHY